MRLVHLVAAVVCITTSVMGAESDASQIRIGSLSFADAPIDRVLSQINSQTSATVAARGKVFGVPVSIQIQDSTLSRVLDMIVNSRPNWLWYANPEKPLFFEIWDQESFRAEVLPKQVQQKIHTLKAITSEEGYRAIQGLLTPKIGQAAFDPRTNKLIVTDLPYVQELIAKRLEQIDLKFTTKVFALEYADPQEMGEHLATLKSPAAAPPIIDRRTAQIVVRDRPDVIRQMAQLVKILDIKTTVTKE